jgi:hypothetical protein
MPIKKDASGLPPTAYNLRPNLVKSIIKEAAIVKKIKISICNGILPI